MERGCCRSDLPRARPEGGRAAASAFCAWRRRLALPRGEGRRRGASQAPVWALGKVSPLACRPAPASQGEALESCEEDSPGRRCRVTCSVSRCLPLEEAESTKVCYLRPGTLLAPVAWDGGQQCPVPRPVQGHSVLLKAPHRFERVEVSLSPAYVVFCLQNCSPITSQLMLGGFFSWGELWHTLVLSFF